MLLAAAQQQQQRGSAPNADVKQDGVSFCHITHASHVSSRTATQTAAL
jgi:hypothetical protein